MRPASTGPTTRAVELLTGFHGVRYHDGVPFRWSAPVAAIRLGVPSGAYEIRLDRGGIPPELASRRFAAYFNAHPMATDRLALDPASIALRIDADHFVPGPAQRLVLAWDPVRRGTSDYRELGMALVAVKLRRCAESTSRLP